VAELAVSSLEFLEPPVEIGLFLRVGGTPGAREREEGDQ
jgi:hypothetical protein